VFYLPLLYYPIQDDDRATGFLLPMYGSSLATGNSISNAFFWAINRSHDATFFHDWMFSRGQGLGAEYRYLLGPRAQADLRYYWLDEKETIVNGLTRQPRRSTSVRGGLSQNLPFGLTARARVDYVTDVTVRQTYDHDFYNASNSMRTVNGGLSGSWRNLSVSGAFNQVETFSDSNTSTVSGQTPGFTAVLSGVKFGPLPVFATVNGEAGRAVFIQRAATRENDATLWKADFSPSIRAVLSTLPYLQVNATAAYRTTYYSESLATDRRTQVEEPVTRSYGDMRVDIIGPVFSGVFNFNNAIADRIKHVIEPSFSVSRRTEIPNQTRIPNATGWDIIVGGVTQMNYALTNRLMVRKEQAGEPASSAPREMLAVTIRQSYYTDASASRFDSGYSFGYNNRGPSSFSPIALTTRAMPVAPMAVNWRLEYDPEAIKGGPRILGMSLNGVWRTPSADISTGWNRQAFATRTSTGAVTEARNYLQSSADLRLWGSRVGGVVAFNYDVAQSVFVNQRYVGFYNAQCCGFSFEYQAFNYPNSSRFLLPRDRRFNMSFTLAGIGSFSNFLGAFGGVGGMR